jgi:hypothetical protein
MTLIYQDDIEYHCQCAILLSIQDQQKPQWRQVVLDLQKKLAPAIGETPNDERLDKDGLVKQLTMACAEFNMALEKALIENGIVSESLEDLQCNLKKVRELIIEEIYSYI